MKNNIKKISTVSIVCALMASGAYAAASVRSLGGTGVYNGTTAASVAGSQSSGTGTTSGSSAIGAARASAMRVTPSSNKSGTATSTSTTNTGTRAASSSRVSLGQYLAGNKAANTGTSGGSSTRPGTAGGSSASSSDFAELEQRVSDLETQADGFITNGDLQNELSGYVSFDDLDEYIPEIPDKVSAFENDAKYVTEDDLEGYVTDEDLQQALQDADIPTSDQLNQLDEKITAAQQAAESAQSTADKADAAAQAANEALDKKADKATSLEGYGIEDAYTKEEIDEKLTTLGSEAGDLKAPAGVEDGYYWLRVNDNNLTWEKIEIIDAD